MSQNVGIFRLQLFKPSEGFIQAQAQRLQRYRPIYLGRRRFGPAPVGADVVTPTGNRIKQLRHLVETAAMRRAGPFLNALAGRELALVHAHFAIDGVFAAPIARQLDIPLLTTLHGFDVTRSSWDMLRSGRPSLINGVLGRSSLFRDGRMFLCVSEFIRQAAISRGFPIDRLRVHYIGIDCDRLQSRNDGGDKDLIVHVARLVEKKGTSYLLKAFAKVRRHHPTVRLVIVGDGPLRDSLQLEAQSLGIGEAVQFLGVVGNAEVLTLVRQAAVQVVPSVTSVDGDTEGFGIVNLEAGAQGVPVVGFRSGGIVEAIEDGYSGLLCDERDVDALARHICSLLDSSSRRLLIGQQARRFVKEHFDLSKQTEKLERIYDEIVER